MRKLTVLLTLLMAVALGAIAQDASLVGKIVVAKQAAISSTASINADTWYVINSVYASPAGSHFTIESNTATVINCRTTGLQANQLATAPENMKVLVKIKPVEGGFQIQSAQGLYVKALSGTSKTTPQLSATAAEAGVLTFEQVSGANAFHIKTGTFWMNRSGDVFHSHTSKLLDGFTISPVQLLGQEVAKTITVKHRYKGVDKQTTTKTVNADLPLNDAGLALPIVGLTATVENGTTLAKNVDSDVVVNYTDGTLPFQFTAANAEEAATHWFSMKVRNKYVKYDSSTKKFPLSPDATLEDACRFKFVGDPFGFKVYNKVDGSKALGNANANADNGVFSLNAEAQEREFVLWKNGADYTLLIKGTANNFVNDNASRNILSTWNSQNAAMLDRMDNGSIIIFTEANETTFYTEKLKPAIDEAVATLNRMKATGALFPNADRDLTAIQAMTASSDAEVTTKRSEITNLLKAQVSQLAGKQFTLHNNLRNTFLSTAINGQLIHNTTTSAPERVWTLVEKEGGMLLQNAVTHAYAQIVGQQNYPIWTSTNEQLFEPIIVAGPNDALSLAFKAVSAPNATYPAIHAQNGSQDLVIWEVNAVASHWKLGDASAVTAAEIFAAAKTRLATAKNNGLPMGAGMGQYHHTPTTDQQGAEQSNDLAKIAAAAREHFNKTGYAINLPTSGKFYRFAPKQAETATDKRYLAGDAYTGPHTAAANALSLLPQENNADNANTIFYLKDEQLINLGTGKAVAFSDNKVTPGDYSAGQTLNFGQAASTGLYNVVLQGRNLAGAANLDYTSTVEASSKGGQAEFRIEEVAALPLTATVRLGDKLFGSFYTPVAGQLAGTDVMAYTVKTQGATAIISPIQGTAIPAGSAFLFSGTDVKFNIAGNTAPALTNNQLEGYDVSTNVGQAGEWGLSKSLNAFAQMTGVKKRAFRAFITGAPAQAQGLTLSFGEVTAVDQVVLETTESAPLYDLAGRRVAKAVKGGLYVRDGKKIVF